MKRLFGRGWPPGIRAQLSLWYLLVFSILLLLGGIIFYINLNISLETSFEDDLRTRTQQIAAGIVNEQGNIVVRDVTGALPNSADRDHDTDDLLIEKRSDVNLGTLVRILDVNKKIIYVSPAFLALHVPTLSITQPLQNIPWQGTVAARNGQAVHLYSAPLKENNKIYGVIQVGESQNVLNSTMKSVALELLIIAPFFLLLSALGSYWLAGRAFAPIHRLTRTARSIEAGDLHERVPVPRTNDEMRQLALTFNDMIARLDMAFAQQRRFVADASHELRTPVAAIRSMTDVVLARSTPVESEEYAAVLRDVNSEAERLGMLINDLLALARVDEGQTQLEHEPVRLDQLAGDVVATMEPLAHERGIMLEAQAEEAVTVLGDEARLIQVIMNLIDNALAYSNAGGRVTIRVRIKQGQACLSVTDTGIGIAREHLPHIFERFYRADPARSRRAGGTGLGLAIVQWVVKALGGTLTVESVEGEGSTFLVLLPLVEEHKGETALLPRGAPEVITG